jgi:hypothetical protein
MNEARPVIDHEKEATANAQNAPYLGQTFVHRTAVMNDSPTPNHIEGGVREPQPLRVPSFYLALKIE